jgi:NAD(P)-dependent dehydrogenase (short-subunit alcohol dehydrogenase family)
MVDASADELERFWNLNVKGTFLCLQAVNAVMKTQDMAFVPSHTGSSARELGRGPVSLLRWAHAIRTLLHPT